jgi:Zn-dependent oligopeptidase
VLEAVKQVKTNILFVNSENVLKIANLRLEISRMLGFSNFAEMILGDRMADTPAKVEIFLCYRQLGFGFLDMCATSVNLCVSSSSFIVIQRATEKSN